MYWLQPKDKRRMRYCLWHAASFGLGFQDFNVLHYSWIPGKKIHVLRNTRAQKMIWNEEMHTRSPSTPTYDKFPTLQSFNFSIKIFCNQGDFERKSRKLFNEQFFQTVLSISFTENLCLFHVKVFKIIFSNILRNISIFVMFFIKPIWVCIYGHSDVWRDNKFLNSWNIFM